MTGLTPSPPRLSNWSTYANRKLASTRQKTWKNIVRHINMCDACRNYLEKKKVKEKKLQKKIRNKLSYMSKILNADVINAQS